MSDAQRRDEIQGDILHEYDGIEEADNNLPNWWLATFYGAILFSIGYWFYYHEFDVEPTQSEAYAAEAASMQTAEAATEPELLALVDDQAAIAAGQETFATTCAACHGDRGQGATVHGPGVAKHERGSPSRGCPRNRLSFTLMKNCPVAESACPGRRAMAIEPRSFCSPFCHSFLIPSRVGFFCTSSVKPPPWIMKSFITRWKIVPS